MQKKKENEDEKREVKVGVDMGATMDVK